MPYGLVSIVMPVYNHAEFVEEAVRSVLDQTYRKIEVLIIDDGSSDASPDIVERTIEKYPDRNITFLRQSNQGAVPTINRGLRLARGDYIAFIASDDAYLPRRIEAMAAAIDSQRHCCAAYCDGFIIDSKGRRMGLFSKTYPVPFGHNLHRELLIDNWIPALGVTYRRQALLDCGGFDERVLIEDLDVLLRLSQTGRFLRVAEPLFSYRVHPASVSQNQHVMRAEMAKLADKHADLRQFKELCASIKQGRLMTALPLLPGNLDLLVRLALRRTQRAVASWK